MRVIRSFALAVVSLWLCVALGGLPSFEGGAFAQSQQPESTEGSSPDEAVTQTVAPAAMAGTSETGEDLGAVYNRKLHGVEEQVNGLKEKVFRSKARLLLLRETVLHGVVSGAKAILYHINELGAEYAIETVTYYLDGTKIYSRADNSGELARKKEIKIYEGSVPPGNHQVTANVMLRGNGFGIFSYLNQYTLKVQGNYSFISQEGKVSRVRIIVYERKGLQLDFTDRPFFRYEVQTDRNLPTGESL